jgi:hypothetical protein
MSTKISATTVTQVKILGSLKAHREDEGTRAVTVKKIWIPTAEIRSGKMQTTVTGRPRVGTPEPRKHARPQALGFFPCGIRRLSGTVNEDPENLSGRSDESHVVPVKPHEELHKPLNDFIFSPKFSRFSISGNFEVSRKTHPKNDFH